MDLRTKFINWLINLIKSAADAKRLTIVYNGDEDVLPCGHHTENYREYRGVEYCVICRDDLKEWAHDERNAKNG